MSEHLSITPNENDKNVLVPFSNDRIEVMRLSDQIDESGRQVAYKVEEDGKTITTKAGAPEAYGDEVQAYYAHKLAMDRNPTPEQMERGVPMKVVTELGDAALEGVVEIPRSSTDDMSRLLDPAFDAESLSVEGAAVRPERTEEEKLEADRKSRDAAAWQANIADYERRKNDRE